MFLARCGAVWLDEFLSWLRLSSLLLELFDWFGGSWFLRPRVQRAVAGAPVLYFEFDWGRWGSCSPWIEHSTGFFRASMADFGLWKQAWMWLQSQKHILAWAHTAACGSRERLAFLVDQHWPAVSRACATFSRLALAALRQWRGCMARGVLAVASLGPAAVFVMLWSFFVCMTSPAWALYALLSLVRALQILLVLLLPHFSSDLLLDKDFA